MLLDWSEIVGDLTTDVLIAVFLSTSVGLMFWSMEQLEHGVVSPATNDAGKENTNDAGKEVTKEAAKEVFFAGVIALVTFAVLIMLRVAMLLQRVHILHESTSALEKLVPEMEGAAISFGLARPLVDDLREHSHAAVVLTAEASAGSALASLLECRFVKAAHGLDAEPGRQALERTSRLAILTAAGRCAQYWMDFAGQSPANTLEAEKSIVLLKAANEFLTETASDVARSNRLIVANIRYVTRLVCSTLIGLGRLADYRRQDDATRDWRPVWLVFTTYHPQIWFAEDEEFLVETGIPRGTLHLQYWGRYLRMLRHLTGRHGGPALCIRAFCAASGGKRSEYMNYLQRCTVSPFLHVSPSCELIYQALKGDRVDSVVISNIAIALAMDVALSIPNIPEKEQFFKAELGGPLAALLGSMSGVTDAETVRGQFEEWYSNVEKNERKVAGYLQKAEERMHAWELVYLSVCHEGPRIDNLKHTREVMTAIGGPTLTHIDGGPLEILLDALLIFWESKAREEFIDAGKAFNSRWHSDDAAAAFCVSRPKTDPGKALEGAMTGHDALQELLHRIPTEGDVHAFGLVQKHDTYIDWGSATWLLAAKSAMKEKLGVARIDFLNLENGQISLAELKDPAGGKTGQDPRVSLSRIAQALENAAREDATKHECWRVE